MADATGKCTENLWWQDPRDFVTAVDEKNIIVVKEVAENEELMMILDKTAEVIVNTAQCRC